MTKKNGFPQGWVETTLGEVFKWGSGGTPLKSRPQYYGGDIPWLIIGDLNDGVVTDSQTKITKAGLDNSSAKWVEEGSILIAMYGSIGKLGIAGKRLTTNQAIAFTKPEVVNPKYLFYYLLKERDNFHKQGIGVAQKNISQTIIKAYPFILAPRPEQERIVAKLEETFTQLEVGVAELQNAKAQLKRYRAAVLKSAVEGELTREWRESHHGEVEPAERLLARILSERREKWEADELAKMQAKGKEPKNDKWKEKYKEPVLPNVDDLPEIPDGWLWTTTSQLGEITGGLTKHGSKRKSYPIEIPYLRVANVYANELVLDEIKNINVKETELDRVLLAEGDLLVVEGNGSRNQIGRVALWDRSIDPCAHQNHLIKVRFNPVEIGEFVLYWLLSNGGRSQIMLVASSTSGLYTLSLSKVSALAVPLPPLEEQKRIIEKLERRLSVADKIEKELEESLVRSERLRSAVLKSAFEGRLV
ncbi:MAG: restriction endonuclease subunit S [Anaerolineales bacterium]|nr:restriction endonuclease subunit S [Chloroflexota bacterium]MBL6982133.1 restriction endonuclease subunit S [Anaerolineales bacterium]